MSLESEMLAKLNEYEQNERRWINARDIWFDDRLRLEMQSSLYEEQRATLTAENERLKGLVISLTSGGVATIEQCSSLCSQGEPCFIARSSACYVNSLGLKIADGLKT